MKYHFPSAIITGRGAAVYSWRNKFAGATAVYNFSVAGDEDHLQVKRNKWRVRMFSDSGSRSILFFFLCQFLTHPDCTFAAELTITLYNKV